MSSSSSGTKSDEEESTQQKQDMSSRSKTSSIKTKASNRSLGSSNVSRKTLDSNKPSIAADVASSAASFNSAKNSLNNSNVSPNRSALSSKDSLGNSNASQNIDVGDRSNRAESYSQFSNPSLLSIPNSVASVHDRIIQVTTNSQLLELLMNPAEMLQTTKISTAPITPIKYSFLTVNITDTLDRTFMNANQNKSDVVVDMEMDEAEPQNTVPIVQDTRMTDGKITRRNRLLAAARAAVNSKQATVFDTHERTVSLLSRCFIFFTRFATIKGYATRKECEVYVDILRNVALPKKRDKSFLFISTFKFLVLMKLQDCFPNHLILKSAL